MNAYAAVLTKTSDLVAVVTNISVIANAAAKLTRMPNRLMHLWNKVQNYYCYNWK
jgi:hypothetical protein